VQDTKGSKAFYYFSCHQETSTPEEKQACACWPGLSAWSLSSRSSPGRAS